MTIESFRQLLDYPELVQPTVIQERRVPLIFGLSTWTLPPSLTLLNFAECTQFRQPTTRLLENFVCHFGRTFCGPYGYE